MNVWYVCVAWSCETLPRRSDSFILAWVCCSGGAFVGFINVWCWLRARRAAPLSLSATVTSCGVVQLHRAWPWATPVPGAVRAVRLPRLRSRLRAACVCSVAVFYSPSPHKHRQHRKKAKRFEGGKSGAVILCARHIRTTKPPRSQSPSGTVGEGTGSGARNEQRVIQVAATPSRGSTPAASAAAFVCPPANAVATRAA